MYPIYDYKSLTSETVSVKSNVLLFLLIVLSKFMPMYATVSLALFIVFLLVKGILNKKMSSLNKINELMVTLLSVLICYDLLDYTITWSLSIVGPLFVGFFSAIFTLLILIKKKGWDMYYHKHMYAVLMMLLLMILCIVGVIESNIILHTAVITTALSMFIVYIYSGKEYFLRFKQFSHL